MGQASTRRTAEIELAAYENSDVTSGAALRIPILKLPYPSCPPSPPMWSRALICGQKVQDVQSELPSDQCEDSRRNLPPPRHDQTSSCQG